MDAPLSRDPVYVTEDIAEIRKWIDGHDLLGHEHPAPEYSVIAQRSVGAAVKLGAETVATLMQGPSSTPFTRRTTSL